MSFNALIRRLERLNQARPPTAQSEVTPEHISKMGPEELRWHLEGLIEGIVGPFKTFASAEDMCASLRAVAEQAGESASPTFLEHIEEHFRMRDWFKLHEPHGPPRLRWINNSDPRWFRFGPEYVLACPCVEADGADDDGYLEVNRDLIPSEIRRRLDDEGPTG